MNDKTLGFAISDEIPKEDQKQIAKQAMDLKQDDAAKSANEAAKALEKGNTNYPPPNGMPECREAYPEAVPLGSSRTVSCILYRASKAATSS